MKLTNLDYVLMNIDLVASFRGMNSKTELNGNKCKLLNDYIKDLEKIVKVLYANGNLDKNLTSEQQDLLIKLTKNIKVVQNGLN